MRKHQSGMTAFLLLVVTFIISSCSTTPPQYYLLTPAQEVDTFGSPDQQDIILGPVSLPEYLDRVQIVTRISNGELHLSDNHRWAEPLEENFSTVLAENLYVLNGSYRITVFPGGRLPDSGYRVIIDVARFDAEASGDVQLTATWSIIDVSTNESLHHQRSSYAQAYSQSSDYRGIVEALSKTVSLLSRDIHETINQVKD